MWFILLIYFVNNRWDTPEVSRIASFYKTYFIDDSCSPPIYHIMICNMCIYIYIHIRTQIYVHYIHTCMYVSKAWSMRIIKKKKEYLCDYNTIVIYVVPRGYERINPFDLETELDPKSLINYCLLLIIFITIFIALFI